jgi:hypothetical protein
LPRPRFGAPDEEYPTAAGQPEFDTATSGVDVEHDGRRGLPHLPAGRFGRADHPDPDGRANAIDLVAQVDIGDQCEDPTARVHDPTLSGGGDVSLRP